MSEEKRKFAVIAASAAAFARVLASSPIVEGRDRNFIRDRVSVKLKILSLKPCNFNNISWIKLLFWNQAGTY